jgi:hypothetical protein
VSRYRKCALSRTTPRVSGFGWFRTSLSQVESGARSERALKETKGWGCSQARPRAICCTTGDSVRRSRRSRRAMRLQTDGLNEAVGSRALGNGVLYHCPIAYSPVASFPRIGADLLPLWLFTNRSPTTLGFLSA